MERKLTKPVKSQKEAVAKVKKQMTNLAERCSYGRYGRTRARGVEEIDFDNVGDDFWVACCSALLRDFIQTNLFV